VDVLVNNLGIFAVKDFVDIDDDEWMHYFNVNVLSCVRTCRYYLPRMLERNAGRIIFISSECGVRPIPRMTHYSMTKAAQISIARGLAELTRGTKVTVNSLLPGPTYTEGVQVYMEGIAAKEGRKVEDVAAEYFTKDEPTSIIGRFIQPEEIGHAAVFLAENGAVNGSALRVEGGIVRSI
jgi:NAD(P)-dependent dehydrogenase (short-subunit alcohol dehydrogenase family)